jgi:general stress protein 26
MLARTIKRGDRGSCATLSGSSPSWLYMFNMLKRLESNMPKTVPVTELSSFSSPGAAPTEWPQAQEKLAGAELYWISTVRPDGRPHVTPLLGIWFDGSLYFCTGSSERKAKNLAANTHCILMTGHSTLEGLDLVIEGTAESVSDQAELGRVAATYETKYGAHFAEPDGTWAGLGDAIRQAQVLVYRVAPETAFGCGKGGLYSQTRWAF